MIKEKWLLFLLLSLATNVLLSNSRLHVHHSPSSLLNPPLTSSNTTTKIFSSAILQKVVMGASIGCSGYLCAQAFSRSSERHLLEQMEEVALEVKHLKLEQQYLQYTIQELNNSYYKRISMMRKKIKLQNDTIAQLVEANDNKFINIDDALSNITSQIALINDLKLTKLQNIFQKEIEQVCQSLKMLEQGLPSILDKSEEKLLKHIDKHSMTINRLLRKR
jgi:hypothetical protein